MFYLNPKSLKFLQAKKLFHHEMLDFVLKRIDNIRYTRTFDKELFKRFLDIHINHRIDDILIGSPQTLVNIHDEINPFLEFSADFKKGYNYIFNYKAFIEKRDDRYDAYDLAESLDVRTCTYCNRNYTNTIMRQDGEKLARPQFDHFFTKSKHPVMAISFHNLIPSCSVCNASVKGDDRMNLSDYCHPYVDDSIDDITFTYAFSNKSRSGLRVKVDTPAGSKAEKSMEVLAIEEVYNSHVDILQDLLKKERYFSKNYLFMLKKGLLAGVAVSDEEMYRIAFGTEYEKESFVNRPFSKFKSDILKEIMII